MRFIHTADIHYGMKPDSDKSWSKERSQAIKEALENIIYECKNKEVDCLFIAGDLFHRQPLVRELKEVNYLFSTIPDVHIVIIFGNHDYISESSSVLSFPFAQNVSCITSKELSSVYFPDINTEVFGLSYHSYEMPDNKLAGLKAPGNNRLNILLAHGGDLNHLPFNKYDLEKSGFSYCALGHIHKHEILADNKVVFCGSPEPLDSSETGIHGFYLGDINPVTRQISSLEFIPCAKLQYISLVINVTPESTNTELLMSISDEINRRGADNIYKLKIKGMRDPDLEFDLDVLKSRFRISSISDESEPKYDFSELFAKHSSDMIGFFIRELNKPDISDIDKKALYYGVNALLRTTDERS